MKLYHVLIMTVIAVGFILAFTAYEPDSRGFIYEMAEYNSDINTSQFTGYDYRSEIDTETNQSYEDTLGTTVTDEDSEQSIYAKLWQTTRNLVDIFHVSKNMGSQTQKLLGIPSIVFWILTSILVIFLVAKIAGRFLLDR